MSLTKRLAEVNGGMIDFSSQPGEGSVFWVVLSATEFEPETRASPATRGDDKAGRGERILLVAREDGERELVARYLAHAGFGITSVETLVAAVQSVRAQGAALVLIDNDVLDYSSEDILGALRSALPGAALPCVLLSSRAFVFDIEKYLRAGVDRCLTKPVDMRMLAQTCRDVLDAKTVLGASGPTVESSGQQKVSAVRRSRADDVLH